MRPATEPKLRKALAALIEAQHAKERAEAAYNAARKAWNAASDDKREQEGAVAALLAAERGAVIYDGLIFAVDKARADRVTVEPVARDLKPTQEALPLGGA